jgi:hypothetical protein
MGDDQTIAGTALRRMTAMWADTTLHQINRFGKAMDEYRAADADYSFRATFEEHGVPSEWVSEYENANRYLTQHQVWNVGAERYFLLVALAQLRKCVMRLPSDDLPELRDQKMLRLLRDIDEHWEQLDNGRSLKELREWKPELNAAPGAFWFNNKHVWVGDTSLTEVASWVADVDRAVRHHAAGEDEPIPEPDDRLADLRGD